MHESLSLTCFSLICSGTGSCTRRPSTLSSLFSLSTRFKSSSWLTSSGSTINWLVIPEYSYTFTSTNNCTICSQCTMEYNWRKVLTTFVTKSFKYKGWTVNGNSLILVPACKHLFKCQTLVGYTPNTSCKKLFL